MVGNDCSVASACVELTGMPYVTPANDLYGGIQTIRYNRSRLFHVTGFNSAVIDFSAFAIPQSDGYLGIAVDGALVTGGALALTTDAVTRSYSLPTGLDGTGSHTLDIWEGWQERVNDLDTGMDGSVTGSYVSQIELPDSGSVAPITAENGIVIVGDSFVDGDATDPQSFNGWSGQLRRAAMRNGKWMTANAGYGSSTMCGDGLAPSDWANLAHLLWADLHATKKHLLILRRPNDYAYYGIAGSVDTTPTEYGACFASMFAALDASDPGWQGIYTRVPQGTSWVGNQGGYYPQDYMDAALAASTAGGRTNVTVHDCSADVTGCFGLVLATDYVEAAPFQEHQTQAGQDKIYGVVCGWYGLC
jgi:hypothetical protein